MRMTLPGCVNCVITGRIMTYTHASSTHASDISVNTWVTLEGVYCSVFGCIVILLLLDWLLLH